MRGGTAATLNGQALTLPKGCFNDPGGEGGNPDVAA